MLAADKPAMILATANSDYRIENEVCTGVRSHAANAWMMAHPAIGRRLLGGIAAGGKYAFAKYPNVGMRLVFDNDVVTSPVIGVRSACA